MSEQHEQDQTTYPIGDIEPAGDVLGAVDFAGRVLAQLADLSPTDRLTVFRLIRQALTDHWSKSARSGNLRGYDIARKVLADARTVHLTDRTLVAFGQLLPAADRVQSKSAVAAALDVQGQMLELAAGAVKASTAKAQAARKPRTKGRPKTTRPPLDVSGAFSGPGEHPPVVAEITPDGPVISEVAPEAPLTEAGTNDAA